MTTGFQPSRGPERDRPGAALADLATAAGGVSGRGWWYSEEDALTDLARSYASMSGVEDLQRERQLIGEEMATARKADRWLFIKHLALCEAELARRGRAAPDVPQVP